MTTPDEDLKTTKETLEVLERELPHLYELYRASDKNHPDNYFLGLYLIPPNTLAHYKRIDDDLSRLSPEAWQALLHKAKRWVTDRVRKDNRHWTKLFDYLNERKGYIFLLKEGYENIEFIQSSNKSAPDLLGRRESETALLEVKTINISDEDIENRGDLDDPTKGKVQKERPDLSCFLRRKITKKVAEAVKQLREFDLKADRRICYLVIIAGYELWLGNRHGNKACEKIQSLLNEIQPDDVEISVLIENL